MMRLTGADALLAEYDRVHVGPPGKARQLILDAPTIEPGPQWIPCSERLPEEKGRYLVCYTLGGIDRDIRTATFYPGGWLEWDVDGTAGIAHVFAWMPLPEAYEEEDK